MTYACTPTQYCPDKERCVRYELGQKYPDKRPFVDASVLRLFDHCELFLDKLHES